MSLMFIVVVAVAWILLSGFLLVSVCMMSSISNRIELLTEDQLPKRAVRKENDAVQDVPTQPTVKNASW